MIELYKDGNVMAIQTDAKSSAGYLRRYTTGGMMKFDIQRLRSLTTGRLHTEIGHIYEDLGAITGEDGLMTHMLPRAMRSVEPWLREHVKDSRFWDGKFDTTPTGEIELPEPSEEDRKAMFDRFRAMPNPIAGKEKIGVVV